MALRSKGSTARPHRRALIAWCCTAAALAWVLTACSSTPEASTGPSIASSSTSSAGGASSSTSTTRAASPARAYPAGGPTDVVFPPSDPTYELITGSTGCEELLAETDRWPRAEVDDVEGVDTVPLYRSAAYACLGRWADARRTYAEIDTASPTFNRNECERRAVLDWLTPLIDESGSDPAFAPVFVASSEPSPCPSTDTADSTDTTDTTSG